MDSETLKHLGMLLHKPADQVIQSEYDDFIIHMDEIRQTLARENATSSITQRATDTRALLTGHADQYKVAGWGQKSLLAQKVVAKTATEAELAIVKTEAGQRGKKETPLELAKKQLGKAGQLAIAIANIDGMETAGLAALKQCETVEQINELLAQLDEKAKATLAALTGAS